LELEDERLKIECANDKTSINTLNPEDFPLLPGVDKRMNVFLKLILLRMLYLKLFLL